MMRLRNWDRDRMRWVFGVAAVAALCWANLELGQAVGRPTPAAAQAVSAPGSAAGVPTLSIEVESFLGPEANLAVLVRDAAGGRLWSAGTESFVTAPAGQAISDPLIADSLIPLTAGVPVTGVWSAVVPLPGAPSTPLSIYCYQKSVNATQSLTASKGLAGGTFNLQGPVGQATGIAWNATATALQGAWDTAYGAGNAVVSGGPLPTASVAIVYRGVWAARSVPTPTLTTSGLVGGTVAVGVVQAGQPLQRLPGIWSSYARVGGPASGNAQQIININAIPSN